MKTVRKVKQRTKQQNGRQFWDVTVFIINLEDKEEDEEKLLHVCGSIKRHRLLRPFQTLLYFHRRSSLFVTELNVLVVSLSLNRQPPV